MSPIGDLFIGFVSTFRSVWDPQSAKTESTVKPEPRQLRAPNMSGDLVNYAGSAPKSKKIIVAQEEDVEEPVDQEHDAEVESIERDASGQPADPYVAVPYSKASNADWARQMDYDRDMSQLRRIDTNNSALETIRPSETVSSVNESRLMHEALEKAQRPPEVEGPTAERGTRPLVITPAAQKIARENQLISEKQKEAIRKAKLPLAGEVPYSPPKNWKGGGLPQEQIGGRPAFIDRDGMLWKQGRNVTQGERREWDVQPPEGGKLSEWIQNAVKKTTGKGAELHANISLTGKVTH